MTHAKSKYVTQNDPVDVSIQDRYEDTNFFQHCKPPPPPPGNEDLWELQFCRWWGWNWVRKKEEHCNKKYNVHGCRDNKQHEKKQIKALCNCLCFKREPRITPSLQKLYNTPSNTIKPEDTPVNLEKKVDSIEQLERQRNISQKSNRPSEHICRAKCNKGQSWENLKNETVESDTSQKSNGINHICRAKCNKGQSWENLKNETVESSSEGCCQCSAEKDRSNTDESIEYINISCCHHCHSKKKSDPEKCDCETQTSRHINMNANVTQTSLEKPIGATQTMRKHKKKKICLICCHCSQNSCCKCQKSPAKLGISTQTKGNESGNEKGSPITPRVETVYMGGMHYPWDKMLYYNKRFSKFGNPSQNYPWLNEANSDLSDKLYSLKIGKEFASPISGNVYNLTPEKFYPFDKKTTLPDPIEIGEELNYLKKLESEVKIIDLENRGMLDAVCDAILSDGKTSTSAVLEDLTSSYKTQSNNALNDIKNNEEKYESPRFKSYTDEIDYFGIANDAENEFFASDLDTIPLNTNSDINRNDNSLKDTEDLKTLLEKKFSEITMSKTVALNCDLITERAGLKKFTEKNCQTRNTRNMRINSKNKIPTATTRILNPSIKKRCVMPSYKYPDNFSSSPLRATRRTEWTGAPTPNISEIFNKIDEIVLKSKVNNEEIQNVLNAIPKKDYQIRSSEDITNPNKEANLFLKISSTKSTFKDETDVCSISKSEENKPFPKSDEKDTCGDRPSFSKNSEAEGVQKALNTKKRKKVLKPSLIPIKNTDKQKFKKKTN